jgi:hypothetical protein
MCSKALRLHIAVTTRLFYCHDLHDDTVNVHSSIYDFVNH